MNVMVISQELEFTPCLNTTAEFTLESSLVKIRSVKWLPDVKRLDFLPLQQYMT